jgi:antitoxin component YwqK of YwqJK toxin-antitoxin module
MPLMACSQPNKKSFLYEMDYKEIKRGADEGCPNVIVYVNKLDTNYKLKKNFFFDSTYSGNTFAKTFYFKNLAEGPFESVVFGQISQKDFFKNDKYDGERLYFTEGILTEKAHFKDGRKSGTWEYYNEEGKLIKKVISDEKGDISNEEKS